MTAFVLYKTANGQIVAAGDCRDEELELQHHPAAGMTWALSTIPEGEQWADWMVEDGRTVLRPTLPVVISKFKIVADDADEAVLSGFPAGAEVSIDGETYAVQTGVLQITSPMPAIYTITCRHWPHLDWEISIEAVAP